MLVLAAWVDRSRVGPQRFKRRSRQIQAAALDRAGISQDEFDAALATHADHEVVREQQEYLQQLADAV